MSFTRIIEVVFGEARLTIRQAATANLLVLLLLLVVAAACAQKPVRKPELGSKLTADVAEAREPSIIDLRPLTISQEGRPIGRLLADGRTQGTEPDSSGKPAYWVPGPTLRTDGTIILTQGGFTARVERNGNIYVVSPPSHGSRERLFGRISGYELKFADSDLPWAVRVEGATIRFNGGGFPNTIEGTVDDQSRHTALIMVAAFFMDMSITRR